MITTLSGGDEVRRENREVHPRLTLSLCHLNVIRYVDLIGIISTSKVVLAITFRQGALYDYH